MEHEALTNTVIGRAMRVHRAMGSGFLESVYRKALAHELRKAGLSIECEEKLQVCYDGAVVGVFSPDVVVERCIIVETKAVRALSPVHEAQLVNYLTATRIEIGLLLNFGAPSLEYKRKTRIYRRGNSGPDAKDSHD